MGTITWGYSNNDENGGGVRAGGRGVGAAGRVPARGRGPRGFCAPRRLNPGFLPWGTLCVLPGFQATTRGCQLPDFPLCAASSHSSPLLHIRVQMRSCSAMKGQSAPRSNLGKGKFGKAGAAPLCGSLEPKLGTRDLRKTLIVFFFSPCFKKITFNEKLYVFKRLLDYYA